MPRSALVIVDLQNDFLPGGSLAVPGGHDVIPPLNQYIRQFTAAGLPIIATRDWHPPKTTHFKEHGGVWPPHCVQGTEGAAFHSELRLPADAIVVSKGAGAEEDAYSGFQGVDDHGVPMAEVLRKLDVDHIYLGGLATDYCDRDTALDAVNQGFRVTLLLDAMRGINLQPGDIERAIADTVRAGADAITLERLDLSRERVRSG